MSAKPAPSPTPARKPRPKLVLKPENLIKVLPWPKPYWMAMDCHFNQHVVEYLHWRLAHENGIEVETTRRRSMLEITIEVLQAHPGITVSDLKGKRRTRPIVAPRQIAMARIYEERSDSLPAIGRFFGGRDHTTVLHAVRKIGKLNRPKAEVRRTSDCSDVIRDMWANGNTQGEIASEVGINQSEISRYIRRQGWERP